MPYKDPAKRAEYMRRYQEKNREKLNEYQRKSRQENDHAARDRERYANDEEYRLKVQERNREQHQKHKVKRNEAQRLRRRERRKVLIEYLGGKCVGCGVTENLQFDHIVRADKSFTLGRCFDLSWDKLYAEADKCQLLCKKCHELKGVCFNDHEKLADGYRVEGIETIGDKVIVTLHKVN